MTTEQERHDQAHTLDKQIGMEDLDQEVRGIMEGSDIRAAFKIEIMFGAKRTIMGPNPSCLQVFESGKHLHGGGDGLAYWCRDLDTDQGCWGLIPADSISRGLAFCTNCGTINAEKLTGQRFQNSTTKDFAEHVAKIWRQIGMNADIYCKYDPKDIRVEILEKKVGAARAHELRGLFIYPLAHIIKDTAAGASLESRFEALFKA